jgi:hypothetical protein
MCVGYKQIHHFFFRLFSFSTRIKPSALHMLGKHSTTELHPSPKYSTVLYKDWTNLGFCYLVAFNSYALLFNTTVLLLGLTVLFSLSHLPPGY